MVIGGLWPVGAFLQCFPIGLGAEGPHPPPECRFLEQTNVEISAMGAKIAEKQGEKEQVQVSGTKGGVIRVGGSARAAIMEPSTTPSWFITSGDGNLPVCLCMRPPPPPHFLMLDDNEGIQVSRAVRRPNRPVNPKPNPIVLHT